jgi:oxygen-dependent protoporphyrinogen oxidase
VEVFLGYRSDQVGIPLDGFGYLVPEVEDRKTLGTIWSSSLFEGRAPTGHVALTTFLGGARQPEVAALEDLQLLSLVRSELGSIMKVQGEPVYSRINRWGKAIPQYNLGYGAVMESLEQVERRSPGLFFCSNYRGGISVGDCVMSADRTAQTVVSFLKSSTHQSTTAEVQA